MFIMTKQQSEMFKFKTTPYGLEIKLGSRNTDPATSIMAAAKVAPYLSALQTKVFLAFRDKGAMTGGEAEKLVMFSDCKPSTIRHRITELVRYGKLEDSGQRRDGQTVWKIANN